MPNHIQNRLKVIGETSEVQNLLHSIKGTTQDGSEIAMDFNKIKPMPECLNIESGSLGSLAQTLLFGTGGDDFLGIAVMQKRMREFSEDRRREAIELALKYQKNLDEHGCATWYDWSRKNWGTKWNAYGHNHQRNTENTVYFQTAWSPPVELILELSRQFPNVELHLAYADEDTGCNVGKIKMKSGEYIEAFQPDNQSNEAYEIYLELHPDCDYIKMVDGKYEYVDE